MALLVTIDVSNNLDNYKPKTDDFYEMEKFLLGNGVDLPTVEDIKKKLKINSESDINHDKYKKAYESIFTKKLKSAIQKYVSCKVDEPESELNFGVRFCDYVEHCTNDNGANKILKLINSTFDENDSFAGYDYVHKEDLVNYISDFNKQYFKSNASELNDLCKNLEADYNSWTVFVLDNFKIYDIDSLTYKVSDKMWHNKNYIEELENYLYDVSPEIKKVMDENENGYLNKPKITM